VDDTIPEPIARLLRAANANDTDAFLATFTDDGVVDDWGREFVGHAAIREWSDREFVGQRVTLNITQMTREDETLVVTADVGGDGFNGPSHFRFQLDGDQVGRMTIRG
jgi:ketosteroid isomerase-like protein